MSLALSVRGLSKSYKIGSQQEQHSTLTESILHKIKNPRSILGSRKETFHALKDISFDIQQGDVVGIIGRNGAGKSTLLKILSRITEPTSGEIDLYGRVGSLLEVGTGFHPELTGRENIFLNGHILGMSTSEIKKQFDDIVEFSGVIDFLDTPVKRYSSGMYVRLAFAVAANLRSDILIVDEVLAVGDAEFQKKCLSKMQSVSKDGRTILFVSHNNQSIRSLCNKSIWLHKGSIFKTGDTHKIINEYAAHNFNHNINALPLSNRERRGNGHIMFQSVTIHSDQAVLDGRIISGQSFLISVKVKAYVSTPPCTIAITIYDSNYNRIVDFTTACKGQFISFQQGQLLELQFEVNQLHLRPGPYSIELWSGRSGIEDYDHIPHGYNLNVEAPINENPYQQWFPSLIRCPYNLLIN